MTPRISLFIAALHAMLYVALARAASEPEAVQAGLYIATDNDVVAYLDLVNE